MKKVLLFLVCLGAFLLPGLVWARPFAYIANSGDNSVSVIDLATDSVVKNIDVGINPGAVSVNPDGTKVYVANFGADTVSVIDVATNTITVSIPVGDRPRFVVFNPSGTRAYVANSSSDNVSVIDTGNNSVINVSVGNLPYGIAINPDGTKAYVSCDPGIYVVDLTTNTISNIINTYSIRALDIAINSAGTRIYSVANNVGYVWVVDVETEAILGIVYCQAGSYNLIINNTSSRLYVVNFLSNSITVIDIVNNIVVKNIEDIVTPFGLALNPSNSKLYVTNVSTNKVSIFSTATNQLLSEVNVGSQPSSLGNFITPASVISSSETEITFAKTRIGKDSKKQTLTITNQGKLNLNISSVSLTGDDKSDFKIKTNTCSGASISPSGTCEVGLVFKPKKVAGSKSANLSFVSDDPENPTLNVALSGKAIYAKKFVTKKAKTKEVLIKKSKNYYADNLNFVFSSLPKKLKKTKYYLNLEKKETYPLNYKDATHRAIGKYFKITTNLGKYLPSSLKKLYSIKMTFKYSQKEFKNLKKRNKSAKEKNLFLKFRTKNSEWQSLTKYWKGAKVKLNTKKNTFIVKYFSKFEEKNYYFGIGLK